MFYLELFTEALDVANSVLRVCWFVEVKNIKKSTNLSYNVAESLLHAMNSFLAKCLLIYSLACVTCVRMKMLLLEM